jgi:calcineurin-like phosphoesterase family protein
MNDIWFSSDPHFFHEKIIQYANRPFETVEEMNEVMVEKWNARVKPQDIIYLLGDVSFGGSHETSLLLKRLNGNKVLILGNHDDEKNLTCMNVFGSVHSYLEVRKLQKSPVALFHFPIHVWNAKHYGAVHLHGHSHGTIDNTGLRRFDVGVDCWDFNPVNWEEILAILPPHVDEFRDRSVMLEQAAETRKSNLKKD